MPPWRSRAAWCRSPTAATPADRCATRRRSAMSSGCVRRRDACRANRRRGRRCRSRDRWRARSPTSRSSSARSPGPTPQSAVDRGRRRAIPRAARPRLQGRARRLVARTWRHSRSSRRSAASIDANRRVFEQLGCIVEEAEPDFAGVDEAFPTLRYVGNHAQYAALVRERPDWVKDTIRCEVAAGRAA